MYECIEYMYINMYVYVVYVHMKFIIFFCFCIYFILQKPIQIDFSNSFHKIVDFHLHLNYQSQVVFYLTDKVSVFRIFLSTKRGKRAVPFSNEQPTSERKNKK